LLGGTAFTIACTVSNNGLGIRTSSLVDTRANGHTFIDTKFVKTVEHFLGVSPVPLQTPCKVRGFDGQQTTPITHSIELALMVDGRRIRTPMLIVELGEHDMILGRKWFVGTGVLIDCKNRRLIWPDSQPQAKKWGRILTTTKKILETTGASSQHQQDADRRDRNIATSELEKPRTILRRPASARPSTWKGDQVEQYRKMSSELKGRVSRSTGSIPRRPMQKEIKQRKPTIDICNISAAAFQVNLQREDNIFFTTSMFEIDRELEARIPEARKFEDNNKDAQRLDETELQWLQRILPKELVDYADVFSREASNVLPPLH
jgi:hypothetical protein